MLLVDVRGDEHLKAVVERRKVNCCLLYTSNIGELIYFFERACAVSGYMLGVNPFNQPGVESYKKNMFALLGKPGYESEREKLVQKIK